MWRAERARDGNGVGRHNARKVHSAFGRDGMRFSLAKVLTVPVVQGCCGDHMGNALKSSVQRLAHRKCSE